MDGWIKLQRAIKEHWIWKDPVKLKWWIDILISVNHAPTKVNIGNQLFECGRGQSIQSLSNWASQWGVSKDKARNFLVLLEKDGMISHESVGKSTQITVCKYDIYQGDLHDSQTIVQRSYNDHTTQSHPNKNDKNVNNENNDKNKRETKRFSKPTIEELEKYISENSYSISAKAFYDYYEANGWMVGRNKMKDWRAAVRSWNSREWKENNGNNGKRQNSPTLEFEKAGSNPGSGSYHETL